MAETADYSPGDWAGHDFKDARKSYDAHVGRSYSDAAAKGTTAASLVPAFIETDSEAPLIIACDVTGSMGEWPATIFSKLPYLDIEGKSYLGEDLEISFGAIGDVNYDKYPFQIRPFSKGLDLEKQLKGLICEGGGGGNHFESYELGALYAARNIRTPNADKPIMIFIGDEALGTSITKAHAAAVNVVLEGPRVDTSAVFEELKAKFSVYAIRKRFDGGTDEPQIHKQWVDLLGADRIAMLQDPGRVVDVIFGILARETGKIDYFKEEIEGRQEADKVDTVYKSLKTIHANLPAPKPKGKGKSVMHLPAGKKTKHLLGK